MWIWEQRKLPSKQGCRSCPGVAQGPCRPTLMLATFPSGLWELCLASDMDNNNISTHHRNTDLRNEQKMPQNPKEVLNVWCAFSLEWARIPRSFCTKESPDTGRRSWLSILHLKVLFKLRESFIKCTEGVCSSCALQWSCSPFGRAVTDLRWRHKSDISAAHYVLEQAWAHSAWLGTERPIMLSCSRGKEEIPWKIQPNTAANSWGIGLDLQSWITPPALPQHPLHPLLKTTLTWLPMAFQSHCGCSQECPFWSCCLERSEQEWKLKGKFKSSLLCTLVLCSASTLLH